MFCLFLFCTIPWIDIIKFGYKGFCSFHSIRYVLSRFMATSPANLSVGVAIAGHPFHRRVHLVDLVVREGSFISRCFLGFKKHHVLNSHLGIVHLISWNWCRGKLSKQQVPTDPWPLWLVEHSSPWDPRRKNYRGFDTQNPEVLLQTHRGRNKDIGSPFNFAASVILGWMEIPGPRGPGVGLACVGKTWVEWQTDPSKDDAFGESMSCQIDDGITQIMGRTLEHLHSKPACDLSRFTMLAEHPGDMRSMGNRTPVWRVNHINHHICWCWNWNKLRFGEEVSLNFGLWTLFCQGLFTNGSNICKPWQQRFGRWPGDNTAESRQRPSFAPWYWGILNPWIILNTILCLVMDFQGIYYIIYLYYSICILQHIYTFQQIYNQHIYIIWISIVYMSHVFLLYAPGSMYWGLRQLLPRLLPNFEDLILTLGQRSSLLQGS